MTIRTPLLTVLTAGLALFALSCTDRSVDPTGPQDHAGETAGPVFAIPGGFTGSSCLELVDSGGAGDGSPCDARLPAGYETDNGVYWVSPLTATPSGLTNFQSGYADQFVVHVDPVVCTAYDRYNCDSETLTVSEGTEVYQTAWKTPKKNGKVPESVWSVKLYLRLAGEEVPLAFRHVLVSNAPSTDQPADEDLLVIQLGSNQPVKFFVDDSFNACAGVGTGEVTCLIGNAGGTLTLTNGAQLNIGAGNGANTYTATYNDCSTGDLDGVDFRLLGCSVTITAGQDIVEELLDTSLQICVFGDEEADLDDAYLIQQDGDGVRVLPPLPGEVPVLACPEAAVALPPGLEGTLLAGASRVAEWFGAKPLIASASGAVGTSGGGRVKTFSDFQLGIPAAAAKHAGWVDGQTVLPGASVTASVVVCTDEERGTDPTGLSGRADCTPGPNSAADGATIWFFPDDGGTLTCPSGFACGTTAWWSGAPAGALGVRTSAAGLASVEWEPSGAGTRELKALGCGIAVPGSNTPDAVVAGGAPGVLGVLDPDSTSGYPACDRNPAGEDLANSTTGYANGVLTPAGAETLDPFRPYITASDTFEVAINDLPITFSVETCASPTIDGFWEDSWECVTGSEDFDVNLSGGGKGSQPQATLLWKNDGVNLYLAVLLPRDAAESSTSLWVEFDTGNGSGDGLSSENDDLIGVDVKSADVIAGVHAFEDRYIDAGCAGSEGSSVCDPAVLEPQNGDGAVAFNTGGAGGDFMFYELSHPLCTVGQATDFCVGATDVIGLFVRLAVGNGAQGKTIWPALRDYWNITIQ